MVRYTQYNNLPRRPPGNVATFIMTHYSPRIAARRYLEALRTEDSEIMFSRETDSLLEWEDADTVLMKIMEMATEHDKALMFKHNGKQNFEEWQAFYGRQLQFDFA